MRRRLLPALRVFCCASTRLVAIESEADVVEIYEYAIYEYASQNPYVPKNQSRNARAFPVLIESEPIRL
jgi:hypothetical protein